MVTNPEFLGFYGVNYMQDMTPAICEKAQIGETARLIDSRDQKLYWVSKLADNNCWMTQNLDLDIPAKGLKATDTDIDSDWMPYNAETNASGAVATITTGNLSAQTWPIDNSLVRSYDPGEYVYTKGVELNSCGTDNLTTTIGECPGWESTTSKIASNDPNFGNDTTETMYNAHYTIGNYYSYNAATAGAGINYNTNNENVSNSICPKGWRLPYSGRNNFINEGEGALLITNNIPISRDKSFAKLFESYGWNKWDQRDSAGNPYENGLTRTTNGFTAEINGVPFYLIRSGFVLSGTDKIFFVGSESTYWSSTVVDSTMAYRLLINHRSVLPSITLARKEGFPIRCVAR